MLQAWVSVDGDGSVVAERDDRRGVRNHCGRGCDDVDDDVSVLALPASAVIRVISRADSGRADHTLPLALLPLALLLLALLSLALLSLL